MKLPLPKSGHKHSDFTLCEVKGVEKAHEPGMKMRMKSLFIVLSVVKLLAKTWIKWIFVTDKYLFNDCPWGFVTKNK